MWSDRACEFRIDEHPERRIRTADENRSEIRYILLWSIMRKHAFLSSRSWRQQKKLRLMICQTGRVNSKWTYATKIRTSNILGPAVQNKLKTRRTAVAKIEKNTCYFSLYPRFLARQEKMWGKWRPGRAAGLKMKEYCKTTTNNGEDNLWAICLN